MRNRAANRRGYALLMVVVFNVIFLALLAVAWRQIAGMLQFETRRAETRSRERETLPAMAWAVRMLENATPTNSYYTISISVPPTVENTSYIDNVSDAETKYFKVEYTVITGGYTVVYTVKVTPLTASEWGALGFRIVSEYEFPTS